MKAVKRQDRTMLWLDPEGFLILTRIRHGENAVGIGAQKQVDIDRHMPTLSIFAPNASFG